MNHLPPNNVCEVCTLEYLTMETIVQQFPPKHQNCRIDQLPLPLVIKSNLKNHRLVYTPPESNDSIIVVLTTGYMLILLVAVFFLPYALARLTTDE